MSTANLLIRKRRSHFPKEFSGLKLSDDLVRAALEAADSAPSHKLTLPWRFTVFSGDALATLCQRFLDWYDAQTPAEAVNPDKRNKIAAYAQQLSHVIGIGVALSGKVPAWEEEAAMAMAVENLWLSLDDNPHAAGYWSTGNGTGSDEMRALCGWDAAVQHRGWFFLGHVETKRTHSQRSPAEQRIRWMQ
jgi:nitroreductase